MKCKFTDKELIEFYNNHYKCTNSQMAIYFKVSLNAIQNRRNKLGLVAKSKPPQFTRKLDKKALLNSYKRDICKARKRRDDRWKQICSNKSSPEYIKILKRNAEWLKNKRRVAMSL